MTWSIDRRCMNCGAARAVAPDLEFRFPERGGASSPMALSFVLLLLLGCGSTASPGRNRQADPSRSSPEAADTRSQAPATPQGLCQIAEFESRQGDAPAEAVIVDGIRCTIDGPSEVSWENPSGPDFRVAITNVSTEPRVLPLPEIVETITLTYENVETGRRSHNNYIEPPRRDGAIARLEPSGSAESGITFSRDHAACVLGESPVPSEIRVCAIHEPSWLRLEYYADGAFDWNRRCEACVVVQLR